MKKILFILLICIWGCSNDEEPVTYVDKCGIVTIKKSEQKPGTLGDVNKIYYLYVDGLKIEVPRDVFSTHDVQDTYCWKVRSDIIFF